MKDQSEGSMRNCSYQSKPRKNDCFLCLFLFGQREHIQENEIIKNIFIVLFRINYSLIFNIINKLIVIFLNKTLKFYIINSSKLRFLSFIILSLN